MSTFQIYYDFMNDYEEFYKSVRNSEEEKLNALLSNDLPRIEASLSAYQSYVRQIQQYEEKRIELCRELGFKSDRFSDIICNFAGDEKIQLILQKNLLEVLVKNVAYLNKKALEIADIQLKYAEEIAEHLPENSRCYDSQGRTDSPLKNSNLLNKMI